MRTVTLCEPSGPLRQGLAQRLEGEGISVRAFADGQAAWDAIHGEPPDALITAHRLPGLSGLDLLALITGASMGIPTVFIASGDNERVVAEALNLGAACCLFQGSADRLHAPLLRALERIFERLRLMDENRLLLEELLEQNDRLERLVEERTAKLARAVEELRSFDETRSTFLSLMGHEIRTPLTSILGFTELLRGGGYDGEEELREILERIESAGGALRRFVEGSLELFEWTSGRVALEARRVEMRELLEGILGRTRETAGPTGVKLELCGVGEASVEADEVIVARLMERILDNAIKFSPEGGTVRVSLSPWGEGVEIEVLDEGPGIDPSRQPLLFRPLQICGEIDHHGQGTGLGLALVKKAVEAHGGSVEVISGGESRGARVRVRLPERIPEQPPLAR